MISLLCPTRKRPKEFLRFVQSAMTTAAVNPEIVCYIDSDDNSYENLEFLTLSVRGPRINMSDMWNKCAAVATGSILMMAGDDMVFRTNDWDTMIHQAFEDCPDKILMVHGDDGMPQNRGRFGVFPTIHRKWVDATGYFVPPVFTGDYADTWLNDVSNAIGRRKYLPYVTEHLHPAWNKAPMDETYKDKLERDAILKPAHLYANLECGRRRDADLLRAVMNGN